MKNSHDIIPTQTAIQVGDLIAPLIVTGELGLQHYAKHYIANDLSLILQEIESMVALGLTHIYLTTPKEEYLISEFEKNFLTLCVGIKKAFPHIFLYIHPALPEQLDVEVFFTLLQQFSAAEVSWFFLSKTNLDLANTLKEKFDTVFPHALLIAGECLEFNSVTEGSFSLHTNELPFALNPLPETFECPELLQAVFYNGASLYLDIITTLSRAVNLPCFIKQSEGESEIMSLAGKSKRFSEALLAVETVTAYKRAGATKIITFHAKQIAETLKLTKPELKLHFMGTNQDHPEQAAATIQDHFIEKIETPMLETQNPHLMFGGGTENNPQPPEINLSLGMAPPLEQINQEAWLKQEEILEAQRIFDAQVLANQVLANKQIYDNRVKEKAIQDQTILKKKIQNERR